MAGGVVGSALLLATPAEAFAVLVPWLIGFASLMILVQPGPQFLRTLHDGRDSRSLAVGVFVVSVYGGYFGAAAGVMILALLLVASDAGLAQSNAVKNVVLSFANGVAALTFVLFAPVAWSAVLPLGLGCLIGGRLGPLIVRVAPARLVRTGVDVAGLALFLKLGFDYYG